MRNAIPKLAATCLIVAATACDGEPTAFSRTNSSQSMVQASVVGSPVDHAAIQEIIDTFDRTWGVDAATYAAQYANADWVGPFGDILNSQQILQLYTNIFPAFAGTIRQSQIRSLTFLTGTIAVLNLDVRLTGALPPFATQWQPGIVRALEKNVLVKRAGQWTIVEHQQVLPAPGVGA